MEEKDTKNNLQLISIIVPIYNAEHKLSLCIDSILQQTYTNLEVLLIDDGSTDCSREVCNAYCLKDRRCKVIYQNNEGVAGARNTGLKIAKGTYIAFVDNDDWIHPQYFEYLHRAINEGDFLLSMVLGVLSGAGDIKSVKSMLPYSTRILSGEMLMAGLFNKSISNRLGNEIPYGVIWASLYRKELLEGLFFKDIIEEDVEYSARVFGRVKFASLVPERMYYWIQYPDSQHCNIEPQRMKTRIDCYLSALYEIPTEKQELRGLGLDCLLGKTISTRYIYDRYAPYRPFKDEVRKITKSVIKTYRSEYMRNRYIPAINKIVFLICYHLPSIYSLGRWIISVKAKIKHI